MITTAQDLVVRDEQDFDNLPGDGRWEVVEGRAVSLPPNELEHQYLSDALLKVLFRELDALGSAMAVSAPNVSIPSKAGGPETFNSRVPDIAISRHKPRRRFGLHTPPDIAIEILATPRGNVERTQKLDDYARAGIQEYWIVNPFSRSVEIHVLQGSEFESRPAATDTIRAEAIEGLIVNLKSVWQAVE